MPYVIEPAAGLTRSLMAFLVDAYDVDEAPNTKGGVDKRTVLRLDPRLAPVKAAVLPLSKKPELQSIAHDLAADLRQHEWMIDYDEAGAIGRRYRREDEIGTPLCITVDFDTIDDQAVTIRERDTMQQERVALDKVADYVAARVSEKRVRYPEGPVSITGTKAADGGTDVAKETGVDESAPGQGRRDRWPVLIDTRPDHTGPGTEHHSDSPPFSPRGALVHSRHVWHEPCRFVGESRDRHR